MSFDQRPWCVDWQFGLPWFTVAKRTSVFDDPTVEIQELTAVIKQDITALNSAVVDLELLCNSRNESGNISRDTTSHSTTVVDDLKNRLMSTTKEFKEVLTKRTEVSKNFLVCWIYSMPSSPRLIAFYWIYAELEGSWEQKTTVFHCFKR